MRVLGINCDFNTNEYFLNQLLKSTHMRLRLLIQLIVWPSRR